MNCNGRIVIDLAINQSTIGTRSAPDNPNIAKNMYSRVHPKQISRTSGILRGNPKAAPHEE